MNNTFIPQAVDIVKQAIDYDNLGEYEKALQLYQKALEYFITGLKYEQNPASKKIISDKVVGYMNRAEEIKKSLADSANKPSGSGGAKTMSRDESKGKDSKEDDEKGKLRGALSSAIVSEKPNVKWDDVAGLEGAKEALKEAVILPTRFPQVMIFSTCITGSVSMFLTIVMTQIRSCLRASESHGKAFYCMVLLVLENRTWRKLLRPKQMLPFSPYPRPIWCRNGKVKVNAW